MSAYWIEFIGDRSIQIQEGESILKASLAAGIPHYHACGGQGKCSTCRVLIKEGEEFVTPPNETEKALRELVPMPPMVRLACQTFVTGAPVSLHRIIRDEVDIEMYIDTATEGDWGDTGEEKELALFFLDIRSFTPFVEAYLPFDVIHVMRRLFTLFRRCIEHYNGRIIETAGDGFYAAFGLKTSCRQAVNDACSAGMSILEEMKHFNEDYLEKHFNYHFDVGIGIHSGRVIVGNIGIGVNNNLTVMGLPVNIASRLQNATKACNNNFIISQEVAHALDHDYPGIDMEIELKGVKDKFGVRLIGSPFLDAAGQ
ncbi:MAG TPA: adenylate/guanylate cyclase domain-containing protein [Flavisolibacter sp.]|nr:adenylate/guanylate cyclase domain-containing protein [Flavisolibacter sp.]